MHEIFEKILKPYSPDQEETILDEYLIEQINDRVKDGIYADDDIIDYDTEEITITDEEDSDFYPETLKGETESILCDGPGESCRYCKNRPHNCMPLGIIVWRASFIGTKEKTVTYKVERIEGYVKYR